MSVRVLQGDCRAVMATLPEASVDSIVTDPPYELGFMGKSWDSTGVANDANTWREALRVLKPGGHLLAFSGTRTYHRMVCAIEDAGFEVRDQIGWVFASGFPKSHNGEWGGTALKPAWEPICMARKPLIGTVAANVLAHGTGGLNIDACRVPHVPVEGGTLAQNSHLRASIRRAAGDSMFGNTAESEAAMTATGRWPANLIHDGSDEVLAVFPLDRSAARFFYCAKADRADRNDGLQGMPESVVSVWGGDEDLSIGKKSTMPRANHHPTVKPTDLMRYLCRLVTPKGGTVLDPFMGSGSTMKAAELEGFDGIGIELSAEYIEIARRRIAADAPLFAEVEAA
ncbi:site-specific DNA-methyltransferase [Methylibium sp.]|uniref:DNA-methyltransferase n=1 Tax=Methylibium sp. TaxID=2067992 RepID=UPI0017D35C7E|nr:site-specific DNA-methyltransferase [Methylibium sp.]MBA3591654.1 site-specific DNA-methyltransferase [Methylibium sp.]